MKTLKIPADIQIYFIELRKDHRDELIPMVRTVDIKRTLTVFTSNTHVRAGFNHKSGFHVYRDAAKLGKFQAHILFKS